MYVMTTRVQDVAGKDMLDADAEPVLLERVIKNWTRLCRDISNQGSMGKYSGKSRVVPRRQTD